MKHILYFVAAAPIVLMMATPVVAQVASPPTVAAPSAQAANTDVVTTGVARGRDRLDSAVSTSSIREADILKLSPRSVTDLMRDIPGVRSETPSGEGNGSFTIRGLPIASTGAKFVQLQEDGLPILEFGDILLSSPDTFLRIDLNLAQVESIRGGSASTFASNAPGGIINFISKTGEVQGGAIQTTLGLDYEEYRTDFDYGGQVSDTLRFHLGGFYRQGEGPRDTGFTAARGGQLKANVTKTFEGGYIRLYGKYLNDRTPAYGINPVRIVGTDADMSFEDVTNFPVTHSTPLSRYFTDNVTVDRDNRIASHDIRDGQHAQAMSIGFEAQFEAMGFTISERFRYSDISNHYLGVTHGDFDAADALAEELAGPGGRLSYASGPRAGQAITDLAGLNGNGLLGALLMSDTDMELDNLSNDLRISRVWGVGRADLTTTVGLYLARQQIYSARSGSEYLTDIRGDGNAALVNLVDAAGQPVTQNGFLAYGAERRTIDNDYAINAPFASANYRLGRFSIGASVRYEFGTAKGSIFGAELGDGRIGTVERDVNGDGRITGPEANVGVVPLDRPAPVDYEFDYLSYSSGINFRIAEPLAVFARYSRGGRVNADRILFSPLVSFTDGSLDGDYTGVDIVQQVEAGVKYRGPNRTLNLTAFQVIADDSNLEHDTGEPLYREYDAQGLEFEGSYRVGPFGISAGATYTTSKIKTDRLHPELEGNVTRHQPDFIFQATPQYSTDRLSIGAVFIGSTETFSDDDNAVLLPGYITTNAFLQYRPIDRLLVSLNANNLFDVSGFTDIDIEHPESGIGLSYPITGRTVSLTARFDF